MPDLPEPNEPVPANPLETATEACELSWTDTHVSQGDSHTHTDREPFNSMVRGMTVRNLRDRFSSEFQTYLRFQREDREVTCRMHLDIRSFIGFMLAFG